MVVSLTAVSGSPRFGMRCTAKSERWDGAIGPPVRLVPPLRAASRARRAASPLRLSPDVAWPRVRSKALQRRVTDVPCLRPFSELDVGDQPRLDPMSVLE